MKKISRLLMSAVLIWIGIGLTSCDELQNAIDNPVSPSLKVKTSSLTLQVGATAQCDVSASSKAKLLYETSDESIATVDANGLITAVAPGDAIIYVTATNQDGQDIFFDQAGQIAVKVTPLWDENNPMPLTFEATVDNASVTFKFAENATPDYKKVEYSLDGGITWTALSSPNQPIVLEKTGDRVMFRGSNNTYNGEAQFVVEQNTAAGTRSWQENALNNTLKVLAKLGGSIKTLTNGAVPTNITVTEFNLKPKTFKSLFEGAPVDIVAEGDNKFLMLPASVALSASAYESMLANTLISTVPELPATQLNVDCYKNTFNGCSQMTGTVNLPAQTLVNGCYEGTFNGCVKLEGVKIRAIAAVEGSTVDNCVKGMLDGTSNVNVVLALAGPAEGANLDIINQMRGTLGTQGSGTEIAIKRPSTISFLDDKITKEYNDANFINTLINIGDGIVKYSIDNPQVATVNETSGEVTIIGAGTATITATVSDTEKYTYATKSVSYTLIVNPKPAESSEGGQSGQSSEGGQSGQSGEGGQSGQSGQSSQSGETKTAATIKFAQSSVSKTYGDDNFTIAATVTGDATISYSSSNTAVAEVDKTTGEVTIVGDGTTKITATVSDTQKYTYATKSVSYTLTVSQANSSFAFQNTEVIAKLKDGSYQNPLVKDADPLAVSYSSSDTSVATVDADGIVSFVKAGVCTITATITEGYPHYKYASLVASYQLTIQADTANGNVNATLDNQWKNNTIE